MCSLKNKFINFNLKLGMSLELSRQSAVSNSFFLELTTQKTSNIFKVYLPVMIKHKVFTHFLSLRVLIKFSILTSSEAMVNERNGEALLLGDAREKAEWCRRRLVSRVPDLEAATDPLPEQDIERLGHHVHQIISIYHIMTTMSVYLSHFITMMIRIRHTLIEGLVSLYDLLDHVGPCWTL